MRQRNEVSCQRNGPLQVPVTHARPAQMASAATPVKRDAPAAPPAHVTAPARATAPTPKTVGKAIDFGGTRWPNAAPPPRTWMGTLKQPRARCSLISNAYTDDMPVLSDCSQERPRISGPIRALKAGATYKLAAHAPGLYGKSWTQRGNGQQVVINKVGMLAS